MPSTGWNVFVASGVAIVVYLGFRMGQVLPALVAGTMLFIGGWMTGYAINQGPPISLPRMLIAGGICGFVIVWTLLIEQGDYVIGGIVIGLVSFAAWFTSELGPIKGDASPTAPIDEPKPPEGPRPGTPLDLGGDEPARRQSESNGSDGSGLLGKIRSFATPPEPEPPDSDAPGPNGPDPDDLTTHDSPDDGGPTYSTRERDRSEAPPTTGERESIFGLGIFYEGDPDGPTDAGASADPEPSSTATEPKGGDHTKPGAADPRPDPSADGAPEAVARGPASAEEPVEVDRSRNHEPAGQTAAPAGEGGEPTERLREPRDSPLRPGQEPATETGSGDELYRGDAAAANGADANTGDDGRDGETGEAGGESGQPEEHRVDVDEGGFMFG
ncbi:hypothetical protein JCM30237_04830 [Halolamina litorea]|uniref:Uncharacterized protein n=1 Tax=Halolamina litorea TaxID=1515593 RepID=A0ABD6BPZ6_9EURY|nr:hypothetical protein [Halolamina litorea]